MDQQKIGKFIALCRKEQGVCYIEEVIKHMRHIVNVGGIECLGLGSDFDGIDTGVEWKDAGHMDLLLDGMKRQ